MLNAYFYGYYFYFASNCEAGSRKWEWKNEKMKEWNKAPLHKPVKAEFLIKNEIIIKKRIPIIDYNLNNNYDNYESLRELV